MKRPYDGLSLYWGDLHCHIREFPDDRHSDGELAVSAPFTLEEVYAFGREDTGLDFAAVTDHDVHLTNGDWQDRAAAAARHSRDGFVAFLGYEWSHVKGEPSGAWGHRNVIYRGLSGPLLRCNEPATDCAPGLWQALKAQVRLEDVVVIPHHPLRAASSLWWNLDEWDVDLERLVEVYSLWGSSEKPGEPYQIRYLREHSPTGEGEAPGHSIQDGLARGYRFGLVGGSESHDGRPGNPHYHGPFKCGEEVCYRGGIQGTYATALERDSLFDAFRARRCYGTTGAKILLRFSLNGQEMGSELPATERREVKVEVHGTDRVARVEVVRNNEEVHTTVPDTETYLLDWTDLRQVHQADWYYVRVTQEDGQMAWSSPIWVG